VATYLPLITAHFLLMTSHSVLLRRADLPVYKDLRPAFAILRGVDEH
jgi:hypothetical protein